MTEKYSSSDDKKTGTAIQLATISTPSHDDDAIDLLDLIRLFLQSLKSHGIFIIIAALLLAAGAYSYISMKAGYKSSMVLSTSGHNENEKVNVSEILPFFTSPPLIREAFTAAGYSKDLPIESLRKSVQVKNPNKTDTIILSVTTEGPEHSFTILNHIANKAKARIEDVLTSKDQNSRIKAKQAMEDREKAWTEARTEHIALIQSLNLETKIHQLKHLEKARNANIEDLLVAQQETAQLKFSIDAAEKALKDISPIVTLQKNITDLPELLAAMKTETPNKNPSDILGITVESETRNPLYDEIFSRRTRELMRYQELQGLITFYTESNTKIDKQISELTPKVQSGEDQVERSQIKLRRSQTLYTEASAYDKELEQRILRRQSTLVTAEEAYIPETAEVQNRSIMSIIVFIATCIAGFVLSAISISLRDNPSETAAS